MASTAPSAAQVIDDEIEMERNAGLIMGTNNSSIVSKRSVERLYLPEPHFYRYFVRKPQRRSPTINRGYWLRMRAVDWVVRQFLEKASHRPKIVMNLGCGYDPLPFQWLATENDFCQNTKFIDVDYEELMVSKREIIKGTSKMRDLLSNPEFDGSEKSILLDSPEYAAIGCDLRNTRRLQRLLNTVCNINECMILLVAEVSITYMHTAAADALIQWTSGLSDDVTFCLLEQGSPDRPDNPFTATMVRHFQKLGTPLHSLFEYPGNHTNTVRFQRAGYTHCEVQNLWELWSNPQFLSISQRVALDQVEPFDEWEEFALFASHYNLVVADNRPNSSMPEMSRSRRDSIASIASDISVRTASPIRAYTQWFAMKHCEDKGEDTQRHHASGFQLYDQDAIAMHGGVGPKARLASTAVCRDKSNHEGVPIVPPLSIGARCCHTITTLANGYNVLIGGRGSPTQPMKDCWLQKKSEWERIEDLPEPRYRHRTVPVTLPDGNFGAVVFGGKTNAYKVASETLLWHPQTGWQILRHLNPKSPMPRFGASFVYLGFNHGLLFGGMREDGVICQGLWRWRLVIRNNKVAGISYRTSNALDASVGAYPWFSRFGASWGLVRDELLIIGGIAKSGCIPKPYEILSILGSFSAFNEHEKEMQLRLTCVEPVVPPNCPRPFLVGHSTHRSKTGTFILMGGGATCFSFGNYYNSGIWIMYEREAGLETNWTVVKSQISHLPNHQRQKESRRLTAASSLKEIRSVIVSNSAQFIDLCQAARPAVMSALDLGECLSTWSPSFLRNKVPDDKSVVIHNSSSASMNFQRKDFAYKTLPFKSFISALESPSSHIYLRALSATNPTTSPASFEDDWPELSSDVSIPIHINTILQKAKHSSCLRISNDITMWLHYDVMANVLFQVHGRKRLVLFPPPDIQHLSFPPGSTTSKIDIFQRGGQDDNTKPNTARKVSTDQTKAKTASHTSDGHKDENIEILTPEGTTPYIVTLNPGDALFIPPLWAHTGISLHHENKAEKSDQEEQEDCQGKTPEETTTSLKQKQIANQYTNIALNIFFRSFPAQTYAAGRDIYGNRDLAAYEDSRRDIERILKRFDSVTTATTSSNKDKKDKNVNVTQTDEMNKNEEENKTESVPESELELTTSVSKDVVRAYLYRLADELRGRADEI